MEGIPGLFLVVGSAWTALALLHAVRYRLAGRCLYLVTLGGGLASIYLVGGRSTTSFEFAMREDGFGEWLTAAAFGGVALAAALRYGRERRSSSLVGAAWLVLGLVALVTLGEEVSWGQRIFGFTPSAFFAVGNRQLETNLHNLGGETGGASPISLLGLIELGALGYGVAAPLFAMFLRRFARVDLLPLVGPPWLVGVFLVVAALARSFPFPYAGEAAELILGAAIFASVHRRDANASDAALGLALVTSAGLACSLAIPAVVGALGEDRVPLARAEVRALGRDVARDHAAIRAKLGSDSVDGRAQALRRRGRFPVDAIELEAVPGDEKEPGEALRFRRQNLLDPWSSPYWFRWEPGWERAAVYSAGPDRRVDTRFELHDRGGDDVVVFVRWDEIPVPQEPLADPAHVAPLGP